MVGFFCGSSMAHTLKIGGDPVVPGLALPEAFEALDKRLESTLRLCQLKGSPEGQLLGVITVCQELQRLLKFAFIENGMLASRVEILTRYHNETIRKMEKKVAQVEVEHKVTRKHLKRLRKRVSVSEILSKKKSGQWWDMDVSTSDYDSLTALSRASGCVPDLEFMLRINQIMVDFVKDNDRTELLLPAMGNEERQELAKLANVYKLRCRYGKSTQLATSTLIKGRQAYTPAAGEVDAVLESFTKLQRRQNVEELEEAKMAEKADPQASQLPPTEASLTEIPPTMLTPLSSLTSPTIELPTPSRTPVQSPPSSGLATPIGTDHPSFVRLTSVLEGSRPPTPGLSASASSESPLPPSSSLHSIHRMKTEHFKSIGTPSEQSFRSSSPVGTTPTAVGPMGVAPVSMASVATLPKPHQLKPPPLVLTAPTPPGGFGSVLPTTKSSSAPNISSSLASHKMATTAAGTVYVQHHGQIRPLVQPTVVASPLKVPFSQLHSSMHHSYNLGAERDRDGRKESEGKRESGTGTSTPPSKRIRITRKHTSTSGSTSAEDEHGRQ